MDFLQKTIVDDNGKEYKKTSKQMVVSVTPDVWSHEIAM